MTTNEESGGGVLTGGGTDVVGNGNNGGGVIMENLIEKSLYDIGDPDLMDVWDTDLNAVSKKRTDEQANERRRSLRTNSRKLTVRRDEVLLCVAFHFCPGCVRPLHNLEQHRRVEDQKSQIKTDKHNGFVFRLENGNFRH